MSDNLITKYLVYLLAITAFLPAWQYNVGITLITYDLVGVLLVLVFIFFGVMQNRLVLSFPPVIAQFIYFLIFLYFIKVLSFVGILIYGKMYPNYVDGAVNQLFIGLLKELFNLFVFTFLASYLSQITPEHRHKVVMVFVYTVVASCLYQFLTLFMILSNGIDIDSIIWPAISYGLPSDFSSVDSGAIGVGFMTFFRAGGFAINPNSLAAEIVAVLPFFIFLFLENRKKKFLFLFLICFMALLFTISRSGFVAFSIAAMIALMVNFKDLMNKFKVPLVLLGILFGSSIIYFFDEISHIIFLRSRGGLGERDVISFIGSEIWSESYLFGVGHNASSVAMDRFAEILERDGRNLHNFWLIKSVEIGAIGLFSTLLFYFFITIKLFTVNNCYSVGLRCSLIGLLIVNFFNNTLANFSMQLFVVLFFCTAFLPQSLKDLPRPLSTGKKR